MKFVLRGIILVAVTTELSRILRLLNVFCSSFLSAAESRYLEASFQAFNCKPPFVIAIASLSCWLDLIRAGCVLRVSR